jgi:hypothetical protein
VSAECEIDICETVVNCSPPNRTDLVHHLALHKHLTERYVLLIFHSLYGVEVRRHYASRSVGRPYDLESIWTVSSSRADPYDFARTSDTRDRSVVPERIIQALSMSPESMRQVCTVSLPVVGSAPRIIKKFCRNDDMTICLLHRRSRYRRTTK